MKRKILVVSAAAVFTLVLCEAVLAAIRGPAKTNILYPGDIEPQIDSRA